MAWRHGTARTVAVLLAVAALAGCIGGDDEALASDQLGTDALLAPGQSLWHDPQTTPHPAFGFPTLTNVPTEARGLPDHWQPIPARPLPETVTGLEHLAGTGIDGDGPTGGGGIGLFGSLAIVPNFQLAGDGSSAPTVVLDISEPVAPVVLSELGTLARDVDFIAFPDGRLFAVLATPSGQVPVWDLTDPADPLLAADIAPPTGSHNVAVVPGTPILYNANTQGATGPNGMAAAFSNSPVSQGVTEIYDLSRPDDPELVMAWENGYGCHDITFHIDPARELYRAYCAGIDATQIWDIEDPRAPAVVTTIPFFHGQPGTPGTAAPVVTQSHFAMANRDATVLIVGDETGSGVAPACDAYAPDGPMGIRAGPGGNLYFYDITDETAPELVSWVSPGTALVSNPPPQDGPLPVAGCTAHFGRLVPHPTQELLAIAYYGAGVVLVDFTDPGAPVLLDQFNEGTNTWDVWYHNGYLFTGDMARGMDVLALR